MNNSMPISPLLELFSKENSLFSKKTGKTMSHFEGKRNLVLMSEAKNPLHSTGKIKC